jgi:hypothetical protein
MQSARLAVRTADVVDFNSVQKPRWFYPLKFFLGD